MVAVVQLALTRHTGSTEGVITDWYRDRSATVRAEFQRVVKDLRIVPAVRWSRPDYDYLEDGVGEIRFKKDHVQWRPLGFFVPRPIADRVIRDLGFDPQRESEVFVLVVGASKKQGSRRGREHENWNPRNAKESAIRIRNDVITRGGEGVAFHVLEF